MPIMPISVLSRTATSLEQLSEQLARTQKVVKYLQEGNLDFENIRARGIIAENIEAGTITANEIAADTITADKMNVDELSAITADLGHITAGLIESIQIFGSYIATANGTYPRSEMDVAGNLFAAYQDANNYIRIVPNAFTGSPGIEFYNGGSLTAYMVYDGVGVQLTVPSGRFYVQGVLFVPVLENITDGINTLGGLLNGKANAFSGYTGNVTAGTSSLHFTNGILTSVT